jgi:hypothetical protein
MENIVFRTEIEVQRCLDQLEILFIYLQNEINGLQIDLTKRTGRRRGKHEADADQSEQHFQLCNNVVGATMKRNERNESTARRSLVRRGSACLLDFRPTES